MRLPLYTSRDNSFLGQGARNSGSPFKWNAQQGGTLGHPESSKAMPERAAAQYQHPEVPMSPIDTHFSPLRQALANVASPVKEANHVRQRQGQTLLPSSIGTMQKMTMPRGTMSRAMASMTMTMRRAGLRTLKPYAESPAGRLGEVAPEAASSGECQA